LIRRARFFLYRQKRLKRAKKVTQVLQMAMFLVQFQVENLTKKRPDFSETLRITCRQREPVWIFYWV
jgi:hypothetical protein